MDNFNTTKELIMNTPVPVQTRTYKPVSHSQLIDLTLNSIEKAGFKLDKETYSSAVDGQVANGRFSISNVADSEMQLQIGWQNSYNKQLTLKFAIGTRILVCSNGCVSGDFGAFKKKHVGEIQSFTPGAIIDYIAQAGEAFTLMQQQRESMKQIEITKRTKAELVGRMMLEEQFITSTQLNIISRELKAPTHDYNAKDSLWELYNYTTFAMKESHPAQWMESHIKAHAFFNAYSDNLKVETEISHETMFNQLSIF
jgi:hypothetical protein